MGRPSKLTKEQWLQVEHEHVVDLVPLATLARRYDISETAIRRKVKPTLAERAAGIPTLRHLARAKADAENSVAMVDAQIAELPETRQIIVHDLVERMKSISVHLTCAAEASAETSHKLTLLAREAARRIDVDKPINAKTRDLVSGISAITRTANEAGAIGMGLIGAYRVGLPGASGEASSSVADLTDAELAAELAQHGIEPA